MLNKQHKLRLVKATHWISQHWLALFFALFGLFNLLPFVAPLAIEAGIEPVGDAIYAIYAPVCHQMAQRSFFLFGDQLMYQPDQLPLKLTADLTANTLALKGFNGNEVIGWKVAWSDRMVYMYGATWLAGVMYVIVSRYRRVKRLSIPLFILLMLPMLIDGGTHMLSDFGDGGLFAGFRYSNRWLAELTGNTLPAWFYTGDRLGSFNSWMRLISGIGFGFAVVWISFPLIEQEMRQTRRILAAKLQQNGLSADGVRI